VDWEKDAKIPINRHESYIFNIDVNRDKIVGYYRVYFAAEIGFTGLNLVIQVFHIRLNGSGGYPCHLQRIIPEI
jgi:hypothetical protein